MANLMEMILDLRSDIRTLKGVGHIAFRYSGEHSVSKGFKRVHGRFINGDIDEYDYYRGMMVHFSDQQIHVFYGMFLDT